MEPYIVGGQIAKIEQFPHCVYMLLTCSGLSWICGASILNQDLVLTAAHCVKACHEDLDVVVYVGSTNLRKMTVVRHVSHYLVHESFDLTTNHNDIALARTGTDMPLGETIKRVIIERRFPRVRRAEISGWGLLDESKFREAEQLQWLPQTFRPGGICSNFALLPGMMCLENNPHNRPTLGDSGCALTTNFVQQIGLVSFRHRGIAQVLIYTNVSYYYDWISTQARHLTCTNE